MLWLSHSATYKPHWQRLGNVLWSCALACFFYYVHHEIAGAPRSRCTLAWPRRTWLKNLTTLGSVIIFQIELCKSKLKPSAPPFNPAGPWLCIGFLVRRVGAGHEWVGEDWLCCSIWLASCWLFRGDGHHWHWEADNSLTAGWRQQSCVHHRCITRQ